MDMDEEHAIEILPQKVRKKSKTKNVNREKPEYINMEKQEGQIIIGNKGIKPAWTSEEETVIGKKKHKRRDKENNRNIRIGDAGEAGLEKNGVLSVSGGDYNTDSNVNDGGKKIKNKKQKRAKNKIIHKASEPAEVDAVEESVSEMKSQKGKIHKAAKKHKRDGGENGRDKGDADGIGTYSADCELNLEDKVERKKRKRERKKNKDNGDVQCQDTIANWSVEFEHETERKSGTLHWGHNKDSTQKIEKKKKKKKKMAGTENYHRNFSVQQQESILENEEVCGQSTEPDGNIRNEKRKFKKKETSKDDPSVTQKHSADDSCNNEAGNTNKRKRKKSRYVEDGINDQTPNKSKKKVRFSGQDEVFPLPDDLNPEDGKNDENNIVRGKRFTKEEDEIVQEAVWNYINEHDLGEEGLDMVLNSSKHPEVKGCWKEIGSSIPYRPYLAVYYRAQLLFRSSETRKWTKEEYEMILKHYEKHGNDWKSVADELGKHRWRVKDTWRRIKFPNLKKGHWSQEEYQKLFDLVNTDLQLKLAEEKKSKHGMLRDNICWTAISEKLSTRYHSSCCLKWYKQLTSPMVEQGLWADADDYRLLGALYSLDASCKEDVDWDNLLDSRSGDVCRKRWNQMVLHLGHYGNQSFAEQVEVLAQRYCPQLIEARETWDNKPRVP